MKEILARKTGNHVVSRIIKSGDKCYYSVYNNPLMEVYQINIENTDTKKYGSNR